MMMMMMLKLMGWGHASKSINNNGATYWFIFDIKTWRLPSTTASCCRELNVWSPCPFAARRAAIPHLGRKRRSLASSLVARTRRPTRAVGREWFRLQQTPNPIIIPRVRYVHPFRNDDDGRQKHPRRRLHEAKYFLGMLNSFINPLNPPTQEEKERKRAHTVPWWRKISTDHDQNTRKLWAGADPLHCPNRSDESPFSGALSSCCYENCCYCSKLDEIYAAPASRWPLAIQPLI